MEKGGEEGRKEWGRGGEEENEKEGGGGKEGDESVRKEDSPTSCLLLPHVWVSTCSP